MEKQKKSDAGIYKILNLVNGKIYIGSSSRLRKRIYEHKLALNKGEHPNTHLQNAWSKHGESNFQYSVVEEIETPSKEYLLEREDYWIDLLGAGNPSVGYNKRTAQGVFNPYWKEGQQYHKTATRDVEFYKSKMYLNWASEPVKEKIAIFLADLASKGSITVKELDLYIRITAKETYYIDKQGELLTEESRIQLEKSRLSSVYQICPDTFSILKEYKGLSVILEEYPTFQRKHLEAVVYGLTKYNKDKPTIMKSIQGFYFLAKDKYDSIENLEEYYKRKPCGMKEGSRRHKQMLAPPKPERKLVVSTSEVSTEYKSIKDFLDQNPDFKRKGIEKALSGERPVYKGKTFKYEINRIPY